MSCVTTWIVAVILLAVLAVPVVSGSQIDLCTSIYTYELTEAIRLNLVDVALVGTGSASGDSVKITVRSKISACLRLTMKPGIILASTVPGEQGMVALRVRGKMVSEVSFVVASEIELRANEESTYLLEAYCLEAYKKPPSASTALAIEGIATGRLANAIAALLDSAASEASVRAKQGAIWVAYENLTVADLLAQNYLESHAEADECQAIVDLAGIQAEQAAAVNVLLHDDGTAEFGFRAGPGTIGAVRFDAAGRTTIMNLRFYVWGESEVVRVYVLDSAQHSISQRDVVFHGGRGWFEIDVSGSEIIVNGTFYVGLEWITAHECPPCSWLGVDKNGLPNYRSYLGSLGDLGLKRDVSDGHSVWQENYMIRVTVAQ